jgi:hypothetical protein
MSRYRIEITEIQPNPRYSPDMSPFRMVPPDLPLQVLSFVATEEQFSAIRKAALEAM